MIARIPGEPTRAGDFALATAALLERELAPDFDLSRPKATAISQALRDAGILSRSSVGRGAPHMTPTDAAALISAWLLDPPISDAATATRHALSTPRHDPRRHAREEAAVFDGLRVASCATFGDALASLIQDSAIGRLDAWIDAGGFSFQVSSFDDGATFTITGARAETAQAAILQFDFQERAPASLVTRSATFDVRILKKLAKLLAPPP